MRTALDFARTAPTGSTGEHTMRQLYTVHTNALPAYAARIATEMLHTHVSASQGGTHGSMITLASRADVRKVAAELIEYGYYARVDRGVGG